MAALSPPSNQMLRHGSRVEASQARCWAVMGAEKRTTRGTPARHQFLSERRW